MNLETCKKHAVFLVALIAGMAASWPAWSQVPAVDAVGAVGGVDFTSLAEKILAVSVAVLAAASAFISRAAVRWFASKTGLQDSEFEHLAAARVNDILHRGIEYAEGWAKAQISDPKSQIRHVQFDNFFLEQAVKYAVRSMPDLIGYFKLTEDRIADMIRARINGFIDVPEANSNALSLMTSRSPKAA